LVTWSEWNIGLDVMNLENPLRFAKALVEDPSTIHVLDIGIMFH
jgi:hypothetical protein